MVLDAKNWARGRSWACRAVILAGMLWVGYGHFADPDSGDIFSAITLGVHELGHVVMGWAPEIVMVAAGSVAQVIAPIALMVSFFYQRDYFAISVAGTWLFSSLMGLSAYIGDARAQELPLVGLDSNPLHDWHFLLDAWGILPVDTFLAQCVRVGAVMAFVGSVAWGSWLLSVMARRAR